MKLTIAWIGKTKNPAIQSLTDDYLKRLKQYADADGTALKDEPALLKLCGRDGRSTRRFVASIGSRAMAADGFSPEVRSQSDLVLSLGKMTLAHELARVVLLEQIYRAFTILKGHPYHLGH